MMKTSPKKTMAVTIDMPEAIHQAMMKAALAIQPKTALR